MDGPDFLAYKIWMTKGHGKGETTASTENLEGALKALEAVVGKLEEPERSLEESIELFEQGTKLSEICYARLKDAEKKVELLVKKVPSPSSRDDFESSEFQSNEG